ncbi:zinc finger and BTB domain-containing protein 24-like [Mercenaria mercenaria]|uniref:zinc finger and BTB domain-containing protein 24-like n=1 Tax=Mercenaria mercenaria TaxID=6596 RepID=UPI00234EAF75|nr:zinc finger and BTB domain-containing protein 24-like [Mercenaria mercenaria]
MAAACNVVQETEESGEVNAELIEAHIVAQAITELQEIQAPATQSVSAGAEDVVLTSEVQTEGEIQSVPGQTHVIYYIEDGAIARTEDRTLVDSSVQANDYEIERRSGKLPARKRVIPVKFRDYKNNSNDEDSDSDYDPHEYLSSRAVKKPRITRPETSVSSERSIKTKVDGIRRVGRPRKNFFPSHTESPLFHDEVISNEVEKMYQQALQLTQNELSANHAVAQVENGDTSELGSSEDNRENVTNSETTHDNMDEDGTQVEHIKMEPGSEEGQSTNTGQSHRMTTRGKRVPVYDGDLLEGGNQGVLLGRGRGRPRMSQLPFYKCAECGKTFKQKGNLKTHIRLHIAGTPYHCPEEGCDKSYRSNESLRRHLLTHQGIKPFQCDICEQRFSSNVALTEHRSRHLDERPYQCPHCQKCFRQISCFRRHVVIHTGDLPYSCTICQKRFAQTAYLKSHMKVHTGEKPFQCTVCFKRFAHQSDVKRHSTTHTGEKRYSCSKCQAKFSDVSSKNRHEREHENNKRYTCTLCNDTFKRPGQLRSHLTKKHSLAFAMTIEKDPGSGVFSFKSVKVGDDSESNSNNLSQQRIVTLIKNLHSKAIPNEGIIENAQLNVPEIVNQPAEIAISADNITDISQLEKEVDASIIEGDIQVPIELQGVEIQGDGNGQTFIAITDLAESLSAEDKDMVGEQMRYRVMYEIDENGEQKQILVPFNPLEEEENIQLEYSTESTVPSCVSEVTAATETIIETVNSIPETPVQDGNSDDPVIHTEIFTENDLEQKVNEIERTEDTEVETNGDEDSKQDVPVSVASGIDYVNSPDFSKQEYYNWLTNFTEFCKVVPMPLDVSLFQKISQVHKTLSDVMATPCGVVADKENFRVLMNISKELSTIINEHLVYVLDNLNSGEKQIVAENE